MCESFFIRISLLYPQGQALSKIVKMMYFTMKSKLCHHCSFSTQALLKKEASFHTFGFWYTVEVNIAFDSLKLVLCNHATLAHPHLDADTMLVFDA